MTTRERPVGATARPADLSHVEWRKSSRSQGQGQNCVEAARFQGNIAVRDSKDPDRAVLTFGQDEWSSFLDSVREDKVNNA